MRRLTAVLLLAFASLLVAAGPAESRVVEHRTGQSPSEVRRYWTPERMRSAIPVDRTERADGPRELAKPGSGGSGTTTSSTSVEVTVSGASDPLSAHGKVFFSDGTNNYVCSGTALADDVVWTAGHCVNEGPGDFYTNFLFVPAYRDGVAPFGVFPASTLLTTERWQTGGAYGVDVGAAKSAANGSGQTLTQAITERTLAFGTSYFQRYDVYGYPAAKKFNGQRMRVCITEGTRRDTSADPPTIGVPCDMTSGSSGGGWVTSTGEVASVTSYGYSSLRNVLFGPHLEFEASNLYTRARAATP